MSRPGNRPDPAEEAFLEAVRRVREHPILGGLAHHVGFVRDETSGCPSRGWALVDPWGAVQVHRSRRAAPEEWVYVLAHSLLHLGLGHLVAQKRPDAWNAACDAVVARFLAEMKLGRRPEDIAEPPETSAPEHELYERFCREGIPATFLGSGTAGPGALDMVVSGSRPRYFRSSSTDEWRERLAAGIARGVSGVLRRAAGQTEDERATSPGQRARTWFMASYPLLGSLASAFRLVEDAEICRRMDVSVAAVDAGLGEIYLNPNAGLTEGECRFVLAHELLHVGLRHQRRRRGRDPFLWNCACDFVINAWLIEMRVGDVPRLGLLHDRDLAGLSAEAVYDHITANLRLFRKMVTFRGGQGLGDMLGDERGWGEDTDLDAFYRRCLAQGLQYHESSGRGFLPAGLVEAIRALEHPPIPWDVELARWFDQHFEPIRPHRTYARLSRRQSATPDIPRPRYVVSPEALEGRTFGVLLDTSGSMERHELATALGAIASYSLSRDVLSVRLVFCDAFPYDQGYVPVESIAGRVEVRGRGGTVLQPAVDLLDQARDFPAEAPLLIITDGRCEVLRIKREHAFLLPEAGRLPYTPWGRVFRMH